MRTKLIVLTEAVVIAALTAAVLALVKENDGLQTKVDDLRRELNFAIRGD